MTDASQTKLDAHRASRDRSGEDVAPTTSAAKVIADDLLQKIVALVGSQDAHGILWWLLHEMESYGYLEEYKAGWLAEQRRQTRRSPKPIATSALAHARDWLERHLASGPKPTTDVEQLAGEAGISCASLKRARVVLGVRSQKRPGKPPQTWLELPADVPAAAR